MWEAISSVLMIIGVAAVVIFISLSGGYLMLYGSKFAKFFKKYGAPIAAVILVCAAMFDLVPEVLESGALTNVEVLTCVILGFVICGIMGIFAGHFHQHSDTHALHGKKQAISMLVIDSIHTCLDGITLGIAFATSPGVGIATATAIAAHEIPQEIGDFSIMMRSKFSKKRIMQLETYSALLLIPSALVAFFVGDAFSGALPWLLAIIAGSFLYIAWMEMAPIIRKAIRRAKRGGPKTVN